MPDLRVPAITFALCAALLSGSQAAADDPFYKGKRLSLIINFAAGGPTDIEGRLLAKHLAKHIDGHPGILVQNMDGAGGMIGAGYLGEVAPKDGTTLGYFTGSAWRYANNPERFRIDFRTYEFVAYQPGTSIAYMRTDVPPGIKAATDIVKAKGVVAGGLGAENSKDLLLRLGLDMLGVPYKYVTSYRGSSAARLALQQNEINLYAESPPSYRAVVEPTLVKEGAAIGIWYDANPGAEIGHAPRQVEGLPILSFPELYRKIKGEMPSGRLWDAYRTVLTINGAMQRQIVLPPGAPPAAVAALRAAVLRLNGDKEHAEEAVADDRLRAGMDGRARHQRGGAGGDHHLARDARVHRRLRAARGEITESVADDAGAADSVGSISRAEVGYADFGYYKCRTRINPSSDGRGMGKGLKSIEGVRPPADRSRAPRRGCACAMPRAYGRRAGAPHTKKKSPAFGTAWFASVMTSLWASMLEWICHWSGVLIWVKVAPCASVPKPLNTRKSPSHCRSKSATVAPLALPAKNTKVSLPPPPTSVFAPMVTSVLAPLLPVPVSPEPVRYIASTLVDRV